MIDILFCGCTANEETNEADSLASTKKNEFDKDNIIPGVDLHKQKTLHAFDQTHLLKGYASLGQNEQKKFIEDLELIHFDFVDLMFHNLVRNKRDNDDIESDNYTMIKSEDILLKTHSRENFEKSLKLISEGKVAFLVNAGMNRRFSEDQGPKCLHVPDWGSELSLLELVVKRAKEIGSSAVAAFGKNFEKKREPISIYLMVNSSEIIQVQNYLVTQKHFGYFGIITFGQDVLPYINESGKMVFMNESKDRLRLATNGSGAVLSALKAQNLYEHFCTNGVQVIQYFDLNNPLIPLADPQLIQETLKNELIIQLNWNNIMDESRPANPTVLYNKSTGTYEYFNQRQMTFLRSTSKKKLLMPHEMKSMNIYIHISCMASAYKSKEILSEYRIKYKLNINPLDRLTDDKPTKRVDECTYYTFEIPFLNILRLANQDKVKFFILEENNEAIVDYQSFHESALTRPIQDMNQKIPLILRDNTPFDYHEQIDKLPLELKIHLYIMNGFCFNQDKFEESWKIVEDAQKNAK